MSGPDKAHEGDPPEAGDGTVPGATEEMLARRRQELDKALAARRPEPEKEDDGPPTGGMAGFAQAMKLSSEFIAGIAVGAGLGWFIDRAFDTSPWGLIIFLLLGFLAGILNVLRSAGVVAQPGEGSNNHGPKGPDAG